jgi:hypothetical protein
MARAARSSSPRQGSTAIIRSGPGGGCERCAKDVELVGRRSGSDLYVIAVRRGGTTSNVRFAGLPDRLNGTPIGTGDVLFEYVQEPPPPPIQSGEQRLRPISVSGGSFSDWFGPHDARVYRFALLEPAHSRVGSSTLLVTTMTQPESEPSSELK